MYIWGFSPEGNANEFMDEEQEMDALFETCSIGNMELRNRFVRSATWEGMAEEDGTVTNELVDLYRDLGKGKIGLVIASYAFVDPRGRCNPGMVGIDKDSLIPGLQRMTGAVHEEGGKIVAQIAHGGAQMSVIPGESGIDTALKPEAPSAVADRSSAKVPEEMDHEAIARVVKAFADAARRAKDSGFDGVQLHSAHGYLLSQFLSPLSNVRTDEYGGPIENRARFVFEVYDAVREEMGPDYPILIKINSEDFHEAGLNADDSMWVCEQLSQKGIAAIELSGGTPAAGRNGPVRMKILSEDQEAYFKEHAKRTVARVQCPIILVGGVRSLEVMEELYNEDAAQFFSMSRPFISEPGLVKRWIAGTRRKARCASCNKCFPTAFAPGKMYCAGFAKLDGLEMADIKQYK
ncbi:MAG: NADH:flavin oxidoreductase [Candidatus Hydrogenedentes bacterium]|nr:NADH:flavin oxidoreductase [Candidatus Hydrogenedentota bacterium]